MDGNLSLPPFSATLLRARVINHSKFETTNLEGGEKRLFRDLHFAPLFLRFLHLVFPEEEDANLADGQEYRRGMKEGESSHTPAVSNGHFWGIDTLFLILMHFSLFVPKLPFGFYDVINEMGAADLVSSTIHKNERMSLLLQLCLLMTVWFVPTRIGVAIKEGRQLFLAFRVLLSGALIRIQLPQVCFCD